MSMSISQLGDTPLFIPSTLLDFMNVVNSDYDTFNAEVASSVLSTDPGMSAWPSQYVAWKKFYVNNTTGLWSWPSRWLNTTWDRTDAFETQLMGWRDRFRSLGGKLSSSDPVLPKGDLEAAQRFLGTLAVLIGVAAAGYVAVKIVPPMMEKRRSL